ncbi:MAG: TetR/AcrR family transcriptional regulator [Acidimicrobiales bacterium]
MPVGEHGDSSPDQRTKILEAAISLLQREGASALTVRNIAKGAECSTTGVYTYFGGKDGLVEAIFIDGFVSFDMAIAAADSLDRAGRAYRDWAIANPTHYLVMFGAAVPTYSPSMEALTVASRAFNRLVELVLDAGPAAMSEEAARADAYHAWAAMHGYVMLELVGMAPPGLPSASILFDEGLERSMRSVGDLLR